MTSEPTPEQVDEWANAFHVELCLLGAAPRAAREWADKYSSYVVEFSKETADRYASGVKGFVRAVKLTST